MWARLRRTGHVPFYVTMGAICAVVLAIGLTTFADRDRPTYWGTFSETSTTCGPSAPRRACIITGRWVSDDGTMVKVDITLDGSVGQVQSVRAAYRPGGPMGDDVSDVVHAGIWANGGLRMPWVRLASRQDVRMVFVRASPEMSAWVRLPGGCRGCGLRPGR
jgi:hypothetical protein